jgi:hypothetical protein
MPIKVITNDLPKQIRESVAQTLREALPETPGEWTASIRSDARNHAWDVEVNGPKKAHWERRFSGDDRDAEVIAEAIRPTIEFESSGTKTALNDALSELAIQGIAFLNKANVEGEHVYIVDRVELRESEIVYLYKQGALSRRGIQKYLLNRNAA